MTVFVYYDQKTFNAIFKTDIITYIVNYFADAQNVTKNNTPSFIKCVFDWDWFLKFWVIFIKPSILALFSIAFIPISKKIADYINLYWNNRTLRNRLNKEKAIKGMTLEKVISILDKLKDYEVLENTLHNTIEINDTNLLGTWLVKSKNGRTFTLVFEKNKTEVKWIDGTKNFKKQIVGFKCETLSICSFIVIEEHTKDFNEKYIQFIFYVRKITNEKFEGFYFDNINSDQIVQVGIEMDKKI